MNSTSGGFKFLEEQGHVVLEDGSSRLKVRVIGVNGLNVRLEVDGYIACNICAIFRHSENPFLSRSNSAL